jgi:mRNA-degrading endonuclease toxin of MazEF toxin-antitoxin module
VPGGKPRRLPSTPVVVLRPPPPEAAVSEGVAAAATVGAKGEEVEVAEEEEGAEEGRGKVVLWRCVAAEPGKAAAVFVRLYVYINDHFAKTGSGQT